MEHNFQHILYFRGTQIFERSINCVVGLPIYSESRDDEQIGHFMLVGFLIIYSTPYLRLTLFILCMQFRSKMKHNFSQI